MKDKYASNEDRIRTNLLGCNRSLVRLPEFLDGLRVAPEIFLASYKNDGKTMAEMHHLRDPLHEDEYA